MITKIKLFLTILIFILTTFSNISNCLQDTDFDKSSGLDLNKEISTPQFPESSEQSEFRYNLLKKNYERLSPSKVKSNVTPIIPKVIHYIWLGYKDLPKNHKYYIETCKRYHPDWEIKIWNEQDIINENFPNMDLYWLSQCYQGRADIIRYEILKKYGGLYLDTDIECFANFDELNHKYNFYLSMDAPYYGTLTITNAIIGSVPNHPILTNTLNNIRKNWDFNENMFNEYFVRESGKLAVQSKHALIVGSSTFPFGREVCDFISSNVDEKVMVLPAGYINPIYKENEQHMFFGDNIKKHTLLKPETIAFQYLFKENSLMKIPDFDKILFGKKRNNKEIKKSEKNKYYLDFRNLFNSNFPVNIEYDLKPQIPERIYLDNVDNLSQHDLLKLKNTWQKLNPFFTIEVLNYAKMDDYFPKDILTLDQDSKKLLFSFYLLNKNGGVYIESNFMPAKLQEFNFKYSYYGVMSFTKNKQIQLDINFIASKANHSIISHFIEEIEKTISKSKKITAADIKNFYIEEAYKYNQLDGKNIIFPENIFNQKR